jgi:transcription initiation factor TFIID subunit 12
MLSMPFLERNHSIRVPGFASDETRLQFAQSGTTAASATVTKKAVTSNAQDNSSSNHANRAQQVQQAKRETKLM